MAVTFPIAHARQTIDHAQPPEERALKNVQTCFPNDPNPTDVSPTSPFEFVGLNVRDGCILYAPFGRVRVEQLQLGNVTAQAFAAIAQLLLRNMEPTLLYCIFNGGDFKLTLDRAGTVVTVREDEESDAWMVDIQFVILEINDEEANVQAHGDLLRSKIPPNQLFQRTMAAVMLRYRQAEATINAGNDLAINDCAHESVVTDLSNMNISQNDDA